MISVLTFVLGLFLKSPLMAWYRWMCQKVTIMLDPIKCYYCGNDAWWIDKNHVDQHCNQLFCTKCTKGICHARRMCWRNHK